MKNIIIAQRNKDLKVLSFMDNFVAGEGTYRVITKCKAGFMITSDIKASSAISICGKHRTLSLHKAHIIEASLDGFEFDRMIEDLLELSKTKLLLVCGEGCQKDIEGAQTLKKYLAKSRRI